MRKKTRCKRGHRKVAGVQCQICHRRVANDYARKRQEELLAARKHFDVGRRPYGSLQSKAIAKRGDMALILKYRQEIAK